MTDLQMDRTPIEQEYDNWINDLIAHDLVRSMKKYNQHSNTNCLEHSLAVSYLSFRLCKLLNLDARAAARGGLLHDFFLYDWHEKKGRKGLHGFHHPRIAQENAEKHFELGDKEKDIIRKHMWPLTLRLPKYRESLVVILADKYCAMVEIFQGYKNKIRQLRGLIS